MDVRDMFYHGVRHQVRRALEALGTDRVEMGLTAFETGASNWSACFFARAFSEVNLCAKGDPERRLMELMGMDTVMPIRITWNLFDNLGQNITMSKKELLDFIRGFLDEKRDPEIQQALASLLSGKTQADMVKGGITEEAFTSCGV